MAATIRLTPRSLNDAYFWSYTLPAGVRRGARRRLAGPRLAPASAARAALGGLTRAAPALSFCAGTVVACVLAIAILPGAAPSVSDRLAAPIAAQAQALASSGGALSAAR